MNEQLKALYDSFYQRQPSAQLIADIKHCHDTLIERLDKPERKLVLEIIDCKDQIAEDMSIDSFIVSVKTKHEKGLVLTLTKSIPPENSEFSGGIDCGCIINLRWWCSNVQLNLLIQIR